MDRLEVHTLICKRDVFWFLKTVRLFEYHSKLDYDVVVHEDGSLNDEDVIFLTNNIKNCTVVRKDFADQNIREFLKNHTICKHFRFSEHHTIFRIKLFDLFYFTKSNNILYMDSDILFCKNPLKIIDNINNKMGFYLKDKWSSYCTPFRDEDSNTQVDRFINAGLNYYPTKGHYDLDHVEKGLSIMYNYGSRESTHPFLEQSAIAYMITQLKKEGTDFEELPEPEYCVPTFNQYIPDHNLTALHLNSSPLVGKWKEEHYQHELHKACIDKI